MDEGTPARLRQHDDPITEGREYVRQMKVDVELNKTLLARTRALIQSLTELLVGKSAGK